MNEANETTYLKGCKGKVQYTSKKQAIRMKDLVLTQNIKMAKKMKFDVPNLQVYECLHCGHWHFGNGWR